MRESEDLLTLTQAAKVAPGRPSSNCLWRWCRRGVLARTGERVRLQHTRVGHRIFTTARWLREFGDRLAAADAAHFQPRGDDAHPPLATPPRRKARQKRFQKHRRDTIEHAHRELEDAGL